MKRVIMVLVVLALLALAVPAFAQDNEATVKKYGPCGTGVHVKAERCQLVVMPSSNENLQVHAHQQKPGPATGGGATKTDVSCITPEPGQAVKTPSGNVNGHCTGKA
jgi:hypothetical protein